MFSPPVSSDDSSLGTGEVLIRSTRVRLSDVERGSRPIRITIQKVQDAPGMQPQRPNPKNNPEKVPPPREVADETPAENIGGRKLTKAPPNKVHQDVRMLRKKQGPTKENRQPTGRKLPVAASISERKQPDDDLLTSHITTGARGAALAALKQRSQSASQKRELPVEHLGPLSRSAGICDALDVRSGSQRTEGEQPNSRLEDGTNMATPTLHIQAPSDMETRVSQMEADIHRLLQANREGADSGRSLSQQTLQHLEMLHSHQMQLQSQLLESAVRMVTAQTLVTTAPSSAQPGHLQVTHLDAEANADSQRHITMATRAAATVETSPVAVATPRRDRWPEHTREEQRPQGSSSVSMATQTAESTDRRSSANDTPAAVREANEMLKEMGRLKAEMKMLLTLGDSVDTNKSAQENQQSKQSQFKNKWPRSKSNESPSRRPQSKPEQSQSRQRHVQQSQSQPQHDKSFPPKSQSMRPLSQNHQPRSSRSPFRHDKLQSTQPQSLEPQLTQPQAQDNQSRSNQSQSTQPQAQDNPSWSNQSQSTQSQAQDNQSWSNQPQSKQTWAQDNQSCPNQAQSKQSLSQHKRSSSQQSQLNQSQSTIPQSHHSRSQSTQSLFQHESPQTKQPLFGQTEPQKILFRPTSPLPFEDQQNRTHQQPRPEPVQRKPSVVEEARQTLRQIRRQRKILDDNLESLQRAQSDELLRCQMESLAAHGELTQEVRIKMTVDAWINMLDKEMQAELSAEKRQGKPAPAQQQRAAVSRSSASSGRGKQASTLRGTGSRGGTAGRRAGAEPCRERAEPDEEDAEPSRQQVSSEAYLSRLYGRAPHSGQRRTLKKSPYLRFSSPSSPPSRKPRPRLVESVRGVKVKSCKTQTSFAPPTLSPTGPPQGSYLSRFSQLTSHDPPTPAPAPAPAPAPSPPPASAPPPAEHRSFVMAIPMGPPRKGSSRCFTKHQKEVTLPRAAPPTSSVSAVDEATHERPPQQMDAGEAPPPPCITVNVSEKKSEDEDEESILPGVNFLSVTDVNQEDVSVVELDGVPSPPPVLYQGPVFPPQSHAALPQQTHNQNVERNQQTNELVNQLAEWVEQEMMYRVISQMHHPPPCDPTQNNSPDHSVLEEPSVASDIGGTGSQVFVDSIGPVDLELVRQLAEEVLAEIVAEVLRQRDQAAPEPEQGEAADKEVVPLVPTPVPTPPPSVIQEVLQVPTPVPTPPPSPAPPSPSPQPIIAQGAEATPPHSPDPTPSAPQTPLSLTWDSSALPVDEERPEEQLDTNKQPVSMSVAEEQPPLASPVPPPRELTPPPRAVTPPPPPEPDSVSSASSSSSSSSSISSAAALKHISEGELVISPNQLVAITDQTSSMYNFSSFLQEMHDMEFDTLSEGEMVAHELLLSRMEQEVAHRGERPQPEGCWGKGDEEEELSVGEIRDNQISKVGASRSPVAREGPRSSPEQMSESEAVAGLKLTNQGPITLNDLMVEPGGTLTSDLHSIPSLSPPPHMDDIQAAGQVRQSNTQKAEAAIDVHLPSMTQEGEGEGQVEGEEFSAAAASDSSSNDVF